MAPSHKPKHGTRGSVFRCAAVSLRTPPSFRGVFVLSAMLLVLSACEVTFGGPEALYSSWRNPNLSAEEEAAQRRECIYDRRGIQANTPPRSAAGRNMRIEQCLEQRGFGR